MEQHSSDTPTLDNNISLSYPPTDDMASLPPLPPNDNHDPQPPYPPLPITIKLSSVSMRNTPSVKEAIENVFGEGTSLAIKKDQDNEYCAGISFDVSTMISSYTMKPTSGNKNPSDIVNEALLKGDDKDHAKEHEYLRYLLAALRTLTPISTEDFLYVTETPQCHTHYEKGDKLMWATLLPAFFSVENARRPIEDKKDKPTIFALSGDYMGYDITEFSKHIEKGEVLLEPNTTGYVTRVEKNESSKIVYVKAERSPLVIESETNLLTYDLKAKREEDNNFALGSIDKNYGDYNFSISEAFSDAFGGDADAIMKAAQSIIDKCSDIENYGISEEGLLAITSYMLEPSPDYRSPFDVVDEALEKRNTKNLKNISNYLYFLLAGLRSLKRINTERI